LGLALLYEDRADDALDAFQAAVGIEPDQPGAHYGAASAAAATGRAEESLASLRAAIALNDRYAAAALSDDRFASLRERDEFRALTEGAAPESRD
jgi:tetratricopeptide (TPR) repeat protein